MTAKPGRPSGPPPAEQELPCHNRYGALEDLVSDVEPNQEEYVAVTTPTLTRSQQRKQRTLHTRAEDPGAGNRRKEKPPPGTGALLPGTPGVGKRFIVPREVPRIKPTQGRTSLTERKEAVQAAAGLRREYPSCTGALLPGTPGTGSPSPVPQGTPSLKQERSAAETECPAARIVRRPYGASYFLPGKLAGHPVHFLIDTGCTTNLLGKHVFDRLPPYVRSQMEECDSHGVMADGTRLPFYGVIRASLQLREAKAEDSFVISQISEDAILGMPFLTANQ